MKNNLLSVASFTFLGLVAGYAIFGQWGDGYINLKTLFSFGGNLFENGLRQIAGIEDMRNKILLCGAAGAVVGALLTFRIGKGK